MASLNKKLNSRFPYKNLKIKDILLEKELNLKSYEVRTLLEFLQNRDFENPVTGDFEPYTKVVQDAEGNRCLILRPEALPVLKEEMSGYTILFLAKELNVDSDIIQQELTKLNDKTFQNSQTGQEEDFTKLSMQADGTTRLALRTQALEVFKKQIQELTSGYIPAALEKELGISSMSVHTLLRTLQHQMFLNPLTGQEEAYTKEIIKKSGKPILGLRVEALPVLKDEMRGYRPVALSEELGINPTAARKLIENLEHKTFINTSTGKEEAYTKSIRHETGICTLGLREEALPVLKELLIKGYSPTFLAEQLDMTRTEIQTLLQTLQNQTFLNPQTKKEEHYTKVILTTGGEESLGLRREALEVLKEEMSGYSPTSLSKDFHAKPEVIQNLLKSLENKTYWNPYTKQEEPYTKMMRDSTGNWCLGLRIDAREFFAERLREISKGCSPLRLSKALKTDLETAQNLIQSLKDKTFLNPNTGNEEACTKQMTNLSSGDTSLALRVEALEWAKNQFKKQTPRVLYTITPLAQELGVSKETAERWIHEVEEATFVNPVTQKEERYTDCQPARNGIPTVGIRVEALEIFKKEYAKKIQRYKINKEHYDRRMSISPTLQQRLKAGSTRGKPKAPPVRKRSTPEI